MRWINRLALAALVLLFPVWYSRDFIGPLLGSGPIDYIISAEFEQLPETDENLRKWLLAQPGVYIARVGRDGKKVVWVWGYAGTTLDDPVTPDLRLSFEAFGYRGMSHYRERKGYRDK